MPDLGQYSTEVLGAYAVSLGLLVAIAVLSFVQSRRMKRALAEAEERVKNA